MQTGTLTERYDSRGADGAKAEDEGGSGYLCETKMHRGASVRTDQAGTRIPAVSLTMVGESTRRVVTDLYDSQSFEVSHNVLPLKRRKAHPGAEKMLLSNPIIGAVLPLDDAHCTG
jgi:hypothetical protein